MRETGNLLRRTHGAGILSERILPSLPDLSVVDSVRNPEEARVLRRETNLRLIVFDAPLELRFDRAMNRGRLESATTLEEFKIQDALEQTQDESALQLQACKELADKEIVNDGNLQTLYDQVHTVLADWMGE